MFLHDYQSGTHFEIFDPKESLNKVNKNKALLYQKLYKINIPSRVQREFQQELKGFIFILDGHGTRIQFPKAGELGLVQQFLVIQVLIQPGYDWTLELGCSDTSNTKRRIVLTTSVKQLERHYFHLKSPIDPIRRGVWQNLCIDIWSFMEGFKAPCKLRKVFLMTHPVEDTELDLVYPQGFAIIPKAVNFPDQFPHMNQVISYRILNGYFEEQLSLPSIVQSTQQPGFKQYDSKNIKQRIDSSSEEEDEYLNLVYDPQLKCFYDPKSNEYYQLNN